MRANSKYLLLSLEMCDFEKIGNLQLKLHCSVKLADPHCLCTRSATNITNQQVCKLTKATGKSYFFYVCGRDTH